LGLKWSPGPKNENFQKTQIFIQGKSVPNFRKRLIYTSIL